MAAIQRDFLHGLVVDDLAHTVRCRFDDGRIGDYLHVFRGFADLELNILSD